MMGNYKMIDYLSNEYALGELGRSYGGNYTNQHPDTSYNNYPNDEPVLRNNFGGSEMIARYSSNPISLAQQSRFNEVANELLDQSKYMSTLPVERNRAADFIDNLSNTFSHDDGRGISSRYQQYNRGNPQIQPQHNRPQFRMLNSYAPSQPVQDNREEAKVEAFKFTDPTIKQERDYRQRYLEPEDNRKQLTLVVIALIVGAFILFMMMQLYSNQKKLEYIVGIYAAAPRHSPYYNIYANDSEMSY